MTRPVVGVIANTHLAENKYPAQIAGERNLRAVAEVAGALPLMFASAPDITDIPTLLATVDGVLLTGGRANVHPSRFNMEPHAGHEPYDERRDALALALIEAAVERGVPVFGLCRGFQEMAVAFGGSLHHEIRELPGRMNHRMPRLANGEVHPDPTVVFADRHDVTLVPGGAFARKRVVVEGVAEDGTIEAIRIADAPGFALGVQWHAEYAANSNWINRALFQAFGAALAAHRKAA
jgi:putative glutamine amidotransferase